MEDDLISTESNDVSDTDLKQTVIYRTSDWVLPSDSRTIGFYYLVTVTFIFLAGSLSAFLLRSELSTSSSTFLTADIYNRLFTAHGVLMIFFFLLPAIPGVLGNLLLPKLLGVRNLAFPKLNILGWYFHLTGGLVVVLVVLSGGFDTGWTFTLTDNSVGGNGLLILAAIGVILSSVSLIILAVNQVVTIVRMRSHSITWNKLSLFPWSLLLAGLITLLAVPVLVFTLFALILQSSFGWGLFDSASAGDPMIQRQLFWFFGRPALYLMVIPAVGILSEIFSSIKPGGIVGKRAIILSMMAVAVFGLFGAGSHLMVSPQLVGITLFSTFLNLATVLPFTVIILSWVRTLASGIRKFTAPLLYAIGCLLLMVVGGMSGIILAASGSNAHLHNTHFVLAHFHYLLAGCVVMSYLGGLHFWWKKTTGQTYIQSNGILSAGLLFIGINLTFFPMFILGFLGMLRRHPTYPEEFQTLNVLSTAGMTILLLGYLFPIFYLLWTVYNGKESAGVREPSVHKV